MDRDRQTDTNNIIISHTIYYVHVYEWVTHSQQAKFVGQRIHLCGSVVGSGKVKQAHTHTQTENAFTILATTNQVPE